MWLVHQENAIATFFELVGVHSPIYIFFVSHYWLSSLFLCSWHSIQIASKSMFPQTQTNSLYLYVRTHPVLLSLLLLLLCVFSALFIANRKIGHHGFHFSVFSMPRFDSFSSMAFKKEKRKKKEICYWCASEEAAISRSGISTAPRVFNSKGLLLMTWKTKDRLSYDHYVHHFE